jgi:hypothetical protein
LLPPLDQKAAIAHFRASVDWLAVFAGGTPLVQRFVPTRTVGILYSPESHAIKNNHNDLF